MNRLLSSGYRFLPTLLLAMPTLPLVAADTPPQPPRAAQAEHVRTLHGDRFDDSWFWLRERDRPEVRSYLEAENAYAEAMTASLAPLREKLYGELAARVLPDDASAPYPKGAWRYAWRIGTGQQYRVWVRQPAAGGPEQVLLDLNELGRDLKFISLGTFAVSDDGSRLAYTLDRKGFRDYTLEVKDLTSGEVLPDRVEKVSSLAWAADGRTLFYAVQDEAKRPYRVYRHTLGQAGAELVYEEPDERFEVEVERSRSGAYVLLTSASHTASEVRVLPAAAPSHAPLLVEPRQSDHEYYLDHAGDFFYIRSNADGRNFALYRAPVASPGRANWRVVRAHDPAVMLERVLAFDGRLVLAERAAGLPRFRVVDLAGGPDRFVTMPEAAYSAFPGPNEEFAAAAFRYTYQSPVTPETVFDYDFASGESQQIRCQQVPGYDASRYEVERIAATAKDGTKVPVTLVHRRGLARDGRNPALLYGYGSYGLPVPISFARDAVSLLDRGFVVAIAHVRGGGEMGKAWHDQGRMANKMNTFTDFIACAEELIRLGWTKPERLAISGGSAGGLLMGAVTNLRPDLFAVVLSYVPFVDVINTMLDSTLPLTVGEFEEWGNPAILEQYRWMIAYSPYENLAARAYPAMLVRTSFWDSQVMYWEPAKYVARLRSLKTDSNPLLFKINLDAGGHGGFAGRYDKLKDTAFDYAFLLSRLGIGE